MVVNKIEILVELSSNRRATLGRLGHVEHRYYLGHTEQDGTIVLRPMTLVPAVPGSHPAMLTIDNRIIDTVDPADSPELAALLRAAGLRDDNNERTRTPRD